MNHLSLQISIFSPWMEIISTWPTAQDDNLKLSHFLNFFILCFQHTFLFWSSPFNLLSDVILFYCLPLGAPLRVPSSFHFSIDSAYYSWKISPLSFNYHPWFMIPKSHLQPRPHSSNVRKSTLNIHWQDWCWSSSSHTLATWFEELTHWKRLWC